jgi:transcription elongation factor GreA
MHLFPVTVHGQKVLQAELDRLKSVERPRIIDAIKTARELGDLKENAEYQEAKREQGMIEGRISDLEGKLSNCQIIDVTTMKNEGKVIFGSTVKLYNENTELEVMYQIVGEDEADIKQQKISNTSPIARSIIGKTEGDAVDVTTPNGVVRYEILEVKYV